MKKTKVLNSKGVTLPELMIAMGIMSVVILGGLKAFEFFSKETKKEAGKMGDLSEFNLLTKDFLKFTEGAGISTVYLNLPIKTSNCNDSEPCLRKQVGENFVSASASDLSSIMSKHSCVQFYKDGKGALDTRKAFPEKKNDMLYEVKTMDLNANLQSSLMATWILKDENSPPILMMKTREISVVLNYLRGPSVETSRVGNTMKVEHAFFESDAHPESLRDLKGYPFLIYNTLFNSHYTIQYASDIVSCKTSPEKCREIIRDISGRKAPEDNDLKAELGANFPDKVFAVAFKEIDFDSPFFSPIKEKHLLPEECKSSWGAGKQPAANYFFPSKAYSVSEDDKSTADLGGSEAINVLHLSHYYTGAQVAMGVKKGLMVALPIDILMYKVEKSLTLGAPQLVTELWHASEIKKKTKISHLKGPFIFGRKIGSPEMSIWYNPLSNQKGIGL